MQSRPDFDTLYATNEITASPALRYQVEFSTPGTYTVWLRGMATSASSDSAYVGLGEQMVNVTGFAPRQWDWSSGSQLLVPQSGLYTVNVWMREDGLRVDRLLLTTDTAYLPADFGPSEMARQTEASTGTLTTLARAINYDYDELYRLTSANYATGEAYQYAYDPVGNRLQQIIDGDTTEYLYDAANRLAAVDGVSYTFDNNGNLLNTGVMTNTWDAANRLISANRDNNLVQPIYNGVNDRVAQTIGITTTHFALDVQGLPEVIYTSDGEIFIHLPGVVVTENAEGETRYLLSDGLGSVRQAVDETTQVIGYYEFDPYGNSINNIGGEPYGYTGEWWESYTQLLFLRARWYAPETGTFLSVDPVESEPPYLYVRGNPINRMDPSGTFPEWMLRIAYGERLINFWKQDKWWWEIMLEAEHGDALISRDKKRIAQFVLDDPLYASRWEGECYVPITSITLEGFGEDGRYWSSDSPIFAEIWRQNTGIFYYTGLHPNDPTWAQFIQNEHPGWTGYMSNNQHVLYGVYYAYLQTRGSHLFQHVAATLDAAAVGTSLIQTVAVDAAGIILIGGGCTVGGPGGCAAGAGAASAVDVAVSAEFALIDHFMGILAFAATEASDAYGGYSTVIDGRMRIGEATIHSGVSLVAGKIPETHVQLYVNVKQLLYDFGVDDIIDTGLFDIKAIEIGQGLQ